MGFTICLYFLDLHVFGYISLWCGHSPDAIVSTGGMIFRPFPRCSAFQGKTHWRRRETRPRRRRQQQLDHQTTQNSLQTNKTPNSIKVRWKSVAHCQGSIHPRPANDCTWRPNWPSNARPRFCTLLGMGPSTHGPKTCEAQLFFMEDLSRFSRWFLCCLENLVYHFFRQLDCWF